MSTGIAMKGTAVTDPPQTERAYWTMGRANAEQSFRLEKVRLC